MLWNVAYILSEVQKESILIIQKSIWNFYTTKATSVASYMQR